MLTEFICPDGQHTRVVGCLAGCRMDSRCLSFPTLQEIARPREWTGNPSVTQLLDGTMLAFLSLVKDYAIVPESRAFALLGTAHHTRLDDAATVGESEVSVNVGGVVGRADYLEPTRVANEYILYDYKTWGSYRLGRALGLEPHRIADPSNAVYQRSGAWGKAGTPRQVTVWMPNPALADIAEPTLQLNAYRVGVEQTGLLVTEMRLQVTVRDGGLKVATERGITHLIYMLEIPRLGNSDVLDYFGSKRRALLAALERGVWEEACTAEERWDDTRCRRYCPVWRDCPHGRTVGVDADEGGC